MIDIDALHRRPPGPRLLVYLDQSVVSSLVQGECDELLAVLRRGRASGALVCPTSVEHEDETVLTPSEQRFMSIGMLADELSMGVSFLDREEVWKNEVRVAATSFFDEEKPMAVWREAFRTDPHLPIDRLFPAGLRVTFEPEKVGWMEEEAQQQKAHADGLTDLFLKARESGVTFEEQVETEFRGALVSKMGPIADPDRFAIWLAKSWAEMLSEIDRGEDTSRTGSAFSRYQYRRGLSEFSSFLLREHPDLRDRNRCREFLGSQQLRSMPSLMYPALLFAALCCTPGRKVRDGDVYDIYHLTQGLSRCDVVTADGSWVQWCRDRHLIPSNVRLFSSRELDQLAAHLRGALQ